MITAVISKKGGVAKTTTAVNLAAALAKVGKRVLLLDLDSQASASLSLGVPRSSLFPSLADVLMGSRPLADTIRSTTSARLDLVTAASDLQSFERDIGWNAERETRLKRVLTPIAPRYDFVLMDCPPNLSLLASNALAAADNYLVPATPHFLAIAGLESLVGAADRLAAGCGSRPEFLGIVLTQVDYRTRAARDNAALIRKRFGDRVFTVEIRTNIRLAEAPQHGETIFEFDPRSTGARCYRLLAEELLLRVTRADWLAEAAPREGTPREPVEPPLDEPWPQLGWRDPRRSGRYIIHTKPRSAKTREGDV